jgi:hypothetical protein
LKKYVASKDTTSSSIAKTVTVKISNVFVEDDVKQKLFLRIMNKINAQFQEDHGIKLNGNNRGKETKIEITLFSDFYREI